MVSDIIAHENAVTKALLVLRTAMFVRKSGCQVQSKESVISHLQYINKTRGSDRNYMDNVQ